MFIVKEATLLINATLAVFILKTSLTAKFFSSSPKPDSIKTAILGRRV